MGVQSSGAGRFTSHGMVQQINGHLSHGVDVLGNDGEGWIGETEHRKVVETDQVDVLTDANSPVEAGSQGSHRHQRVGGEDGGSTAIE